MVAPGAQEELNQQEVEFQELRQELAEAQDTLLEWDNWYSTEHVPLLESQEPVHPFCRNQCSF